MKILLLEDDLELCTSIRAELEKSGYVVDCCTAVSYTHLADKNLKMKEGTEATR